MSTKNILVGAILGYLIGSALRRREVVEKIVEKEKQLTVDSVLEYLHETSDENVRRVIEYIVEERFDASIVDVSDLMIDYDMWGVTVAPFPLVYNYGNTANPEPINTNMLALDCFFLDFCVPSGMRATLHIDGEEVMDFEENTNTVTYIPVSRGMHNVRVTTTGTPESVWSFYIATGIVGDSTFKISANLPEIYDEKLPNYIVKKPVIEVVILLHTYVPKLIKVETEDASYTVLVADYNTPPVVSLPVNEDVTIRLPEPHFAGLWCDYSSVQYLVASDTLTYIVPRATRWSNLRLLPTIVDSYSSYMLFKTNVPNFLPMFCYYTNWPPHILL